MNRPIKFRIWNPENRVLTGGLELNTILFTNAKRMNYLSMNLKMVWLQFTGLLDKNGKELYEGDIVRHKDMIYVNDDSGFSGKYLTGIIRFGKGEYFPDHYGVEWYGWFIDGIDMEFNEDNSNEFEIIGNIYENPELLNTK